MVLIRHFPHLFGLIALGTRNEWEKNLWKQLHSASCPIERRISGRDNTCNCLKLWQCPVLDTLSQYSQHPLLGCGPKKGKCRGKWNGKVRRHQEICIRNSICGVSSHRHSQSVAQDPVACKMTASDGWKRRRVWRSWQDIDRCPWPRVEVEAPNHPHSKCVFQLRINQESQFIFGIWPIKWNLMKFGWQLHE